MTEPTEEQKEKTFEKSLTKFVRSDKNSKDYLEFCLESHNAIKANGGIGFAKVNDIIRKVVQDGG